MLALVVGLNDLEPLAHRIRLGSLRRDWSASLARRQDNALAILPAARDAQWPVGLLLEQAQLRRLLKLPHNLNLAVDNSQVPLERGHDAEAVVAVLADALGRDQGAARGIVGDDAELELLQVLVAIDAAHDQGAVDLLGDNAAEERALEQERVVLANRDPGDTLVVEDFGTIHRVGFFFKNRITVSAKWVVKK